MLATPLVLMVNVALVWFGATVTDALDTTAEAELLEMLTTAPPLGAGPFSVTVPVEDGEDWPPTTVLGFRLTDCTAGELMVSAALCVELL